MSDTKKERIKNFKRKIKISANNGCWFWIRSKNSAGYGLAWDGSMVVLAHRLSYELFIAPIPDKYYVCHHCDKPSCVNPSHLFAGTARDNLIDCINKGRRPRTGPIRGQCKNAHLTPDQAKIAKQEIKNRSGTLRDVSTALGISYNIIKDISRGRNY